jgi:hypothetical protein
MLTGTAASRRIEIAVRTGNFVVPFAAIGDLDGDRRDDVLIDAASDDYNRLDLLSGRHARGAVRLRRARPPLIQAPGADIVLEAAEAAGDVDADGRRDLLVAYASSATRTGGGRSSSATTHSPRSTCRVDQRSPCAPAVPPGPASS